jgi:hypothetical protein
VTSDGAALLCEIQKAAAGRPLTVTATVDPKAAIPQLKADYPGLWQITSARTASVAEVLEAKCGVPRTRLKASSLSTPPKAHFEGQKPPAGHVAIQIDFSEP